MFSGATEFSYSEDISPTGADTRYVMVGTSATGTLQFYISATGLVLVDINFGSGNRLSFITINAIPSGLFNIKVSYNKDNVLADRIKVYYDNVRQAGTNGGTGTQTGTMPVYTSVSRGYSGSSFEGSRGMLKLWTTEKTSEEMDSDTDYIHYYAFSEGAGTIVYDKAGSVNGTVTNATLSTFWSTDDEVRPNNLIDGFDLWTNDADSSLLRVPFDINGDSIKTSGDIITGYTWTSTNVSGSWHNGAESNLREYEVPSLYAADALLTTPVLYNHTTLAPLDLEYVNKEYDYGSEHVIFSDAEALKWKTFLVYEAVQTGTNLTKIESKIKKP